MRARNIKPGFFKNEDLADCDPLARILFAGLWCLSDREGRLELRERKIRAEILPYDKCNIRRLLNQLESKKFIIIYCVNGEDYIQICNFSKHQHPHIKEVASTIQAPDEHHTSTVQAPDETGKSPSNSLILIPDSPILIPDSLLPESGAPPVDNHKPIKKKSSGPETQFSKD